MFKDFLISIDGCTLHGPPFSCRNPDGRIAWANNRNNFGALRTESWTLPLQRHEYVRDLAFTVVFIPKPNYAFSARPRRSGLAEKMNLEDRPNHSGCATKMFV